MKVWGIMNFTWMKLELCALVLVPSTGLMRRMCAKPIFQGDESMSNEDLKDEKNELTCESGATCTMEEKLSKLGAKIDEFAAKSAEMREDAKCKLDELNEKRQAAMKRFEELKTSAPEALAELKSGFEKSIVDLQHAFEDIREASAKAKDKLAS